MSFITKPASTNTASTLLVSSPSIFLQRIILIIFWGAMGGLIWWQSAGGSAKHTAQKFSMTPIPAVVTELDFTIAEAAWSGLQIDTQGNLKINARLESALVEAIALMENQTSELQVARMRFLLEKQFGASASQQFMALLPLLKNYKEVEQRWWEENASRKLSTNKPPDYQELFQLQDELLGEAMAKKMFFDQRRLSLMMSDSFQIRNDASLSETEKEQALLDLQTRFQENMSEDQTSE